MDDNKSALFLSSPHNQLIGVTSAINCFSSIPMATLLICTLDYSSLSHAGVEGGRKNVYFQDLYMDETSRRNKNIQHSIRGNQAIDFNFLMHDNWLCPCATLMLLHPNDAKFIPPTHYWFPHSVGEKKKKKFNFVHACNLADLSQLSLSNIYSFTLICSSLCVL